ncbi:MAG: AAA domain-containing protein, partial [Arcobacteraceae bacterium]
MSKEFQVVNDLLEYVKKIGELNQRTVFKIEEYKKPTAFEHTLKNKKGIYTNQTNSENGDPIWLKIDRLKRTDPPIIEEELKEWVIVSKDPNTKPEIRETLVKTLTPKEVEEEIARGIVEAEDVNEPLKLKQQELKLKDVIYRIDNLPEIKVKIEDYILDDWYTWQKKELPIRETIKIYEQFFNIHNTIHNGGDEEQVELVWGMGMVRWDCQSHIMNFPLIEKLIDISINNTTGAIEISPRIIDQKVQLTPFVHLENKGVDNVVSFVKEFYDESKDILFSPFEEETYEEVLRQAVTHIDSKGSYYPDILKDVDDRNLPKIGTELLITDTWVVYLRPRESTKFLEDIKNFQDILITKKEVNTIQSPVTKIVSKQSDKITENKSIISNNSNNNTSSIPSNKSFNGEDTQLYFPKPYNNAQEQIIKKLNCNNGVVVQGPPGTGKTHTIANIICHYLATGKKILVTSEHEPALSVVQEQLPEKIRKLAISILTDESQGNKQLEQAINILQSLVTQTDSSSLKIQRDSLGKEVQKLKNEISVLEAEIRDWSNKQIQPLPKEINEASLDITAMDLAKEVMKDKDKHRWIEDNISFESKHNPQFNDDDIKKLKEIRQKIVDKIEYIETDLYTKDDLPELAQIIAIHNDLQNLNSINEKLKLENIPVMTESISNLSEVLIGLEKNINELLETQDIVQSNKWIEKSFENELFEELDESLSDIVNERDFYVRNLIEIADPTDLYIDNIKDALMLLKSGKQAFGLFSFGKKHEKTIVNNIKINGEKPSSTEDWGKVLNYLNFQINVKKFLVKWNHIG